MSDTRYLEIEQKYKADNVDWNDFCRLVSSFGPYQKLRVFGPDTYYENDKIPSVIRWRHGPDKEEITFKTRMVTRSVFLRNEIDWDLSGTPIKGILKAIKMMGYKKAFRIYKDCQIFWLSTPEGLASIVIYDVFCKKNKNKRFIEIEAEKGQDYTKSKKIVRFWESQLKIHINKRVTRSLYEIYSGKITPIPANETFCGRCCKIQPLKNFFVRKNGAVKPGDNCKECTAAIGKSDKRKASKKRWRIREAIAISKQEKLYRNKNKEKIRKRAREFQAKKYKNDSLYRLTINLRGRLSSALRKNKNKKNTTTEKLLDMSYEDFKKYIESLFYNCPNTGMEMTWENRGCGVKNWQLDHILPLASFDLSDPEQLKKANNAKNIRPLWQTEHILKSTIERKQYGKKKTALKLG